MNLLELQEALLADPRLLDAFLAERPVTTTDAQGRTTHDVAPQWSVDQVEGMAGALGNRNRVNAWMADQALDAGMLNGAPELISMSNWLPGVGIPAALEDIRLGAGDTADALDDGRYLAAAGNAGLLAAMTVPSMLGAPQAARAARDALGEIPGLGRFLADESGALDMTRRGPSQLGRERAAELLGMLRSGRAADITDDMLDLGDPAATAAMHQELFASYDLPMDAASRQARATGMGYDLDTPLYHRTSSDIGGFRPGGLDGGSGDAVWLGEDPANLPQMHNRRKLGDQIIPAVSAADSPLYLDEFNAGDMQARWAGGNKEFPFLVPPGSASELRRSEYDAIIQEDIYGTGDPTEHIALDPTKLRSRFARFDPRLAHLRNLTAGTAGVGLLGADIQAYLQGRPE